VVIFSVPADAARVEAAHTEFVAAYR